MTGSLQVKNGMYYAVLNMRGLDGKRMQKWLPLNIPQKGGKKKAEAMLAELILQYEGINAVEAEYILLSDHLLVWAEHQKKLCNVYNLAGVYGDDQSSYQALF